MSLSTVSKAAFRSEFKLLGSNLEDSFWYCGLKIATTRYGLEDIAYVVSYAK